MGTWADVPRWGDRLYPEEDTVPEQIQTPVTDMARERDGAYLEAIEELERSHADLLDALREIVKNAGYESGEAVVSEFLIQRRYLDTARAAIAAAEGS